MNLFKERLFGFNNRAKVVFLESISDCLDRDRGGNDVVDIVSGLDSIIKLSSGDLSQYPLFIPGGEFGRTSTFAVFFIRIHLPLDSSNSRFP
jgi:hypothetical protein